MAVKLQVYLDTGNVHEYEVADEAKAREHAAAVIATGYRSVSIEDARSRTPVLTWYPPHRIVKVVARLDAPSSTKYFDTVLST